MKFKEKTKDCQLIVKVKTSFGEVIDVNELDRFSRIFIRGFLKPKLIKKNVIEYTGPIGVSLYEVLKRPISKRSFLFIIEQVVVAIHKLHINNLLINYFVMDIKKVFFNEITKEVQFLYIPLTNKMHTNTNIIEFIESIVYSIKLADERDSDFISQFLYYFRSINPFDIMKVESFIEKEDRSVVNSIRKQNAGQSGFMTNKPQHYYEHQDNKKKQDEDEATELLVEEDEATELLVEEDEATELLVEEDDASGFINDSVSHVRFPILYRILTDEEISINKPVFRLGKEKSYVDYFITNNIAVSRSHADIITRGNHYFVKDLNSKNHTYINNVKLPVQCEVEIHDGDNLRLGNEEFIFRV